MEDTIRIIEKTADLILFCFNHAETIFAIVLALAGGFGWRRIYKHTLTVQQAVQETQKVVKQENAQVKEELKKEFEKNVSTNENQIQKSNNFNTKLEKLNRQLGVLASNQSKQGETLARMDERMICVEDAIGIDRHTPPAPKPKRTRRKKGTPVEALPEPTPIRTEASSGD